MANKTRLDVLLVEQGLQETRQKAQATIMSGLVYVNGQKVDKPGTAVANDAAIEVRGNALKYVSRGGLKLEKAMATFPIDLTGNICADIGASTGGFTDCFISLKLILPALCGLLKEGGHVSCLVKPQFEAGREKVGKKGVVRDPAVHLEVLENFLVHAKESGFTVLGMTFSPIRGPEGNIEYLGFLEKSEWVEKDFDLKALVAASHETLKEHGEGNT